MFHKLTGLILPRLRRDARALCAAARKFSARAEGQRAFHFHARGAGGARRVVCGKTFSPKTRRTIYFRRKFCGRFWLSPEFSPCCGIFRRFHFSRRRNFSLLPPRAVVFNRWTMSLTHPLTTTTFELPGFRVTKSFGVVRGIIVRSRSIIGNFGAGIQAIFGGNISLYTNLCERAREDAYNLMLTHAGAARRERGHRRALRRDGNRAGHHRGAVLRHGGLCRGGNKSLNRESFNRCIGKL